jgi:hypothetical protein
MCGTNLDKISHKTSSQNGQDFTSNFTSLGENFGMGGTNLDKINKF